MSPPFTMELRNFNSFRAQKHQNKTLFFIQFSNLMTGDLQKLNVKKTLT